MFDGVKNASMNRVTMTNLAAVVCIFHNWIMLAGTGVVTSMTVMTWIARGGETKRLTSNNFSTDCEMVVMQMENLMLRCVVASFIMK